MRFARQLAGWLLPKVPQSRKGYHHRNAAQMTPALLALAQCAVLAGAVLLLLTLAAGRPPRAAASPGGPGTIDLVRVDADPDTPGVQPCRRVAPGDTFSINFVADSVDPADSNNLASLGNIGFYFPTGAFSSPSIDFAPGVLDEVPGFIPVSQGAFSGKVPGQTHVARAYFNPPPGPSAPGVVGQIIVAGAKLTAGAEPGLKTIGITKTIPLDASYDFFLGNSPNVQPTNTQSATIAIGVDCPSNNPPDVAPQHATVAAGKTQTIALTAVDADGDCQLTFAIVQGPTNGSLGEISQVTCSGGVASATVTYAPKAGFNGADSFSFKASDGHSESNAATVGVTVATPTPSATRTTQPATPRATAPPAAGNQSGGGGGTHWWIIVLIVLGALAAILAAAAAWQRLRGPGRAGHE